VDLGALGALRRHRAVRGLVRVTGGECHLVGGVLRDRLLGLPVKDLDAVVAGGGEGVAERLAVELGARLVRLGGKEFAAFRLVARRWVLDLWDRWEVSLEADMARRDFTVNSFAWAPAGGELTDPFGGLEDLARRLLRATTDASFSGDPLRVLRLPRLLVQLPGFSADAGTVELARASAPGLATVAAERVREELALTLAHPEAHRGVELLARLEIYPRLWLGGEKGSADPNQALALLRALPAAAERFLLAAPELAGALDLAAANWAATFAPLPDPLQALERFRQAGYLTNRLADRVHALLHLSSLPEDDRARRRFLHESGAAWPTAAVFLGARAAAAGALDAWERALPPLVELARRHGAELAAPPRLLTGEEVQALLGVPPGPAVGRALAAVREGQVEGTVSGREDAVRLVESLRGAGG
jgi:poly(A) polymerase